MNGHRWFTVTFPSPILIPAQSPAWPTTLRNAITGAWFVSFLDPGSRQVAHRALSASLPDNTTFRVDGESSDDGWRILIVIS